MVVSLTPAVLRIICYLSGRSTTQIQTLSQQTRCSRYSSSTTFGAAMSSSLDFLPAASKLGGFIPDQDDAARRKVGEILSANHEVRVSLLLVGFKDEV